MLGGSRSAGLTESGSTRLSSQDWRILTCSVFLAGKLGSQRKVHNDYPVPQRVPGILHAVQSNSRHPTPLRHNSTNVTPLAWRLLQHVQNSTRYNDNRQAGIYAAERDWCCIAILTVIRATIFPTLCRSRLPGISVDSGKPKTYLIAFLDDATRYYFGAFDNIRLWGKGRLCYQYNHGPALIYTARVEQGIPAGTEAMVAPLRHCRAVTAGDARRFPAMPPSPPPIAACDPRRQRVLPV